MSNPFVDAYGVKPWAIIGGCVLFIGALILTLVLVFGNTPGCPKGQVEVQTGFVPIMVGKVMVMDPIFTCEAVR